MTWSQNQVSKGKTKTMENHAKGKGLDPNEGTVKCSWLSYSPVTSMFIS